jgi:uncharacterized protein YodC (DUF2158 family)
MSDTIIEYEVGDIVKLKTGGPAMVVEQVYGSTATDNQTIACVWFVYTGVGKWEGPYRGAFSPQSLEPATRE